MNAPPTWDLASFFPTFEGAEHRAFITNLESDASSLRADASNSPALDAAVAPALSEIVKRWENAMARVGHLFSYTSCLASADGSNEKFQLAEAKLGTLRATFEKVGTELKRALGRASDADFAAFTARAELEGARHQLDQLRRDAKFRMSGDLEGLSADLGPDGIFGWGRLYDVVSGNLKFSMTWPASATTPARTEMVPMAQRRSLMADPDRNVRKNAFVQGNLAWEAMGDVVSSSLNHIAGTRHVLNARRGVGHVHEVALRDACIEKKTLDAMMEAVKSGADVARRGLRLKGKAMKGDSDRVAWYDLEAPLPITSASSERLTWDAGLEMIRGAFGRNYPALRTYFDDALAKRWIEAEPRDGKRPGAYCTGSDVTGETRVFMTFQGSYGDVSTLAHEIGHAFHSHLLVPERVLARQYPMTLAETASTFAENLLADGLLSDPKTPPAQKALLLGELAGDASAFLLDIPTRFFFETKFYEERKAGEVSKGRLCDLMAETQREIFGDALAVGGEDPWFWASKLHFFIPDIAFYNFPYTFGFLLSRWLFSRFKAEGASFLPRYEAFLRMSGRAMAEDVVKQTLGRDVTDPKFWEEAIDTLRGPIDELEKLLPTVLPT
ncbi:M3 family oligoendopeptidase [soil metagenome]